MRMSAAFSVTTLIVIYLGFAGLHPDNKAIAQTAPGYGKSDDNIEIFRVPKPGRTPPRRKRIVAPLLSLQWWLMIRNRDCRPQEVDPNAIFVSDDQLRIGGKVNQSGYLYVILNVQDRQDAILIYPDPRINRGRNQVSKNLEVIVPYRCQTMPERDSSCPRDVDPSGDCWWNMTKPYGEKYITLIFSREKIRELENLLEQAALNPQGSRDLPKLSLDTLYRIKEQNVRQSDLRREKVRPGPNEKGFIAANYVTRVTNLNRRDNEEIVETITLKHQPQ
jgi:Domain of unknown function (DUF4384)